MWRLLVVGDDDVVVVEVEVGGGWRVGRREQR
jgi:hypothetical protein